MKNKRLVAILPLIFSILLIATLALIRGHQRFDETLFSTKAVMKTTQRLSDPSLEGRGLDHNGYQLSASLLEAYFKQEGLAYQTLPSKILVPLWNPSSIIQLSPNETYHLYDAFRPSGDYYGSALHYEGDLLYLGTDYYEVDPQLLKGKVICIKTNNLTQDQIEYIRSTGAKGVLYQSAGYFSSGFIPAERLDQKDFEMGHKKGSDFFQAEISSKFAEILRVKALEHHLPGYKNALAGGTTGLYEDHYFGIVKNIRIKADVSYKQVTTQNYIVTVKGRDNQMASNWVTHYDGGGLSPSGDVYPSVNDGALSTALLLELARVAHLQKELPVHDLNFVFLSGLSVSNQSAELVANHLNQFYNHNANWIVEGLGIKDSNALILTYDTYNDLDRMLIHQLYSNLDRFSGPMLLPKGGGLYTNFHRYEDFKTKENAYLTLTAEVTPEQRQILGSLKDDLSTVDSQQVEAAAQLFLGHMDLQLFKEQDFAFIKNQHLCILFIILVLIQMSSLPRKMVQAKFGPKWLALLVDKVPYKVFSKIIQNGLPFLISLLVVNLILSIPPEVNMKTVGTSHVTNFSLYETLRQSYAGMMMFIQSLTFSEMETYAEIGLYLKRSLILVLWGLWIAVSLGLCKGLLDAYFHKKSGSFSTFTSIMLYSIPDVLVAFISLVAVVVLSKHPLTASWVDPDFLRIYFMPLLALTIIPIIYIARVVFVALEEEKQKDYVKFLRYKGLNKKQIYLRHFSRVGFVKILEVSKSVIMLIFSNLIVVEYLFNYPGIMFNLLSDTTEATMVISMSLSIGLSFALLYLISVLLLKTMQPGRKKS